MRGAIFNERQSYLNVVNGLAQVQALMAGYKASLESLQSNKDGFNVGIRVSIDVLNAQNQVYVAWRDLVKVTLVTLIPNLS